MRDVKAIVRDLRTKSLYADQASLKMMDLCMEAAQKLEQLNFLLEDRNKRIMELNKTVIDIPTTPNSGRTVSQYEKEESIVEYIAELEQRIGLGKEDQDG